MQTDLKRILDRFPQFKHLEPEDALERIVQLALSTLHEKKGGKK